MTVGSVPFDPVSGPVNATAWAWSPDNPMRVSAAAAMVSTVEVVGPWRALLSSSDSPSKGFSAG